MKKFTEAQLSARLATAKQSASADGTPVPFAMRYAQLAFVDVPANATERLNRLTTWPVAAYENAPKELQLQVLSWLIDHGREVRSLDQRHAWWEQWQLARIALVSPTDGEAEAIGKRLEKRPGDERATKLLEILIELHPTQKLILSRQRHWSNNGQRSRVIDSALEDLELVHDVAPRRAIWILYSEALLARGKGSKDGGLSDAERAYHAMLTVEREGLSNATVEGLLQRAIHDALPTDLEAGRGQATNFVADAYRGLTRVGKWFGKQFGGRDASVPYSEGVVGSAPSLLPAGAVESWLNDSDRHVEEFKRSATGPGGDLEAAVVSGALTVGGLWTLAQIDGTVLDAMTFASAGNPDSFWRLREVAEGMEDNVGAATRLSGYVAEQQVALDLASGGHVVEFPEDSNQAGFDLIVDGSPVQVKCSLDADYVLEHFERYPDIPVVVNAELAAELGDHPMVFVDQGLTHAGVNEATDSTVEALADFGDADDLLPVPMLSLAFAAYRNFGDLEAGRIDEGTFAARTGVDAAARAIGGGTGAVIGGALGSVVGPAGTAVGAALGSFLGSVAGGTGADTINREAACDARDRVVKQLSDFARWFHAELLVPRAAALAAKRQQIATWGESASAERWAPATVATMHAAAVEAEGRAAGLSAWVKSRLDSDDFDRANAGWVALREANHFIHPRLKIRLAQVKSAMDAYQAIANPGAAGNAAPSRA